MHSTGPCSQQRPRHSLKWMAGSFELSPCYRLLLSKEQCDRALEITYHLCLYTASSHREINKPERGECLVPSCPSVDSVTHARGNEAILPRVGQSATKARNAMATEFNPGGPIRRDEAARKSINPPMPATRERSSWGMIAAAAAIAILVVAGMLFSMREPGTTATNTPSATTGSSSTPSPSNPPAAPGPTGQGESNSTR
jgi:hypothetical protein